MALQAYFKQRKLKFKVPGGTSRGILRSKDSWYLELLDTGSDGIGIGECSVIEGLSPDCKNDLELKMSLLVSAINSDTEAELDSDILNGVPALRFCYEMALQDLRSGGCKKLYKTEFIEGQGLPINGLVWMGEKAFMRQQIKAKIEAGFNCIKIKIAAIDFEEECDLLNFIRTEFREDGVEIRVDANGGFNSSEALEKLKRLSEYNLHSIEQPIQVGQYDKLARLCEDSPVDIALDEELINIDLDDGLKLLAKVRPQYIILKPSLLGGFLASENWIMKAKSMNVGWWVTSALESNIGLNAIAQWTSTLDYKGYQGLGTGQLFSNNIASPLYMKEGQLFHGNSTWADI